jgi:hypothetical protein
MNQAERALHRHVAAHDLIADPAVDMSAVNRTLDDLGVAIAATPRGQSSPHLQRSRRPRMAVLVGATVLVAGAGIATAAVMSARTGQYPTPAEEKMGGPGEALNPAAPDFRDIALQASSDITYPEGYEQWREFVITDEINTLGNDGVVSTGALRGFFASSSFCAWVHSWRTADISGDTLAAAEAEKVISEAPSLSAVTDVDPRPDAWITAEDGSAGYTLFGWMLPYRDAVAAGDRAQVDQLLVTHYGDKCWLTDPEWRAQMSEHKNMSEGQLQHLYRAFLATERS